MCLRDEFLSALRGPNRLEFLLNLEYELSMMERSLYRSSRTTPDPISVVAYCNELRIVAHNQLRSEILKKGGGYPDESLEEVLAEKSQRAGMQDVWIRLVARAMVPVA